MNYFELYPGDYLRDTAELTLTEHGAFLKLLMAYYSKEQPLPGAYDRLYMIAVAMSAADKAAVRKVADEFFPIGDDGFRHNIRVEEEIAKARARIDAARSNGSKGGRPKKAKPNQEKTQQKPSGFPSGSDPLNPADNPNETLEKAPQTPDPISTPDRLERAESHLSARVRDGPTPDQGIPTEAGRACLLMREAGCISTNPHHTHLVAALDEGVTPEALAATVAEAIEQGIAKPFAWAIATARGRQRDGAKPVAATARAGPTNRPLSKTAQGIAALEEMKRDARQRMAGGGDSNGFAEACIALPRPNSSI
jgi:uncharacterized protein YdaU (DUF1376 family)